MPLDPNSPLNTHSHSHRGTISTKSTLQHVNHSGLHEKLLHHHTLLQHTTLLTNERFLSEIYIFHKKTNKKKTPKNSYSVFSNHLMAVCHICSTFMSALLCRNAYSRLWLLKEKKSLKISGNNLQLQPSIFFLRFTYEKKSSLCKHSNYIWWLQMLPLHLFLNIHLCVACRWEKNTHVGRRKPPSSSL